MLRLSGRALLLIIVVILVFGIVVTTDALTLLRLFLWSRCLYRWLYTSCFEFADQFGRQFYFFSREIFNGDEVVVGIDWEWHLFFRFCYFSFSRFFLFCHYYFGSFFFFVY